MELMGVVSQCRVFAYFFLPRRTTIAAQTHQSQRRCSFEAIQCAPAGRFEATVYQWIEFVQGCRKRGERYVRSWIHDHQMLPREHRRIRVPVISMICYQNRSCTFDINKRHKCSPNNKCNDKMNCVFVRSAFGKWDPQPFPTKRTAYQFFTMSICINNSHSRNEHRSAIIIYKAIAFERSDALQNDVRKTSAAINSIKDPIP